MSSRLPCSATDASVARDPAAYRDAPVLAHGLCLPDDGDLAEPSPQDRRDDPAEPEAEQQHETHADPDVPDVQGDRRRRPAHVPSLRSGGTSHHAATSPPELVTLICGSVAIPLRRSSPRG